MLVYGENGVGKSTFAASFPKPLALNFEDGVGDIGIDHTDRLKEFGDMVLVLSWLITEPHGYQTVIVDTVDWLERLVFRQVAQEKGKDTIEDIGWGKGYQAVAVAGGF